MDLAAKSSALLRSKLVMRLSCVLVAVGFLVSSVVTPRARAVAVVDDVAVGAMSCAAFLESIGLPLTATVAEGAASTALVPVGITAVAGEYAAATGAAASGEAFLGTVAAGTAVSTAGTIILTAAAVAAMAGLAYWLCTTYLVDNNGDVVDFNTPLPLYSGEYFMGDGSAFIAPAEMDFNDAVLLYPHLSFGQTYVLSNGVSFMFSDEGYYYKNGAYLFRQKIYYSPDSYFLQYYFPFENDCRVYFCTLSGNKVVDVWVSQPVSFLFGEADKLWVSVDSDYSIPEIQQNQSMEITIPSAAPGSTLAELAETVPQQVADGTLSATYTIDTAAPTPPSISDGDVEDVDELGLPSLGEALTRRFPFSIPWDIARGITLLAAPAKTPYFEVDFYAPISDLVGGWQGSTKLVLDFSQFESLGRLSRWTSTIGFCLFLASATKRFIWTA